MERHGTPPPTRDGWALIEIKNLDPWMHPITLAGSTHPSAPNWEQLSGGERFHLD
jgi:hypothetical protein